MTPEQYATAVDAAVRAAGPGELWNQLFIAALNDQGLMLQPIVGTQPPPAPHFVQAPWPYSQGLPIWTGAWIVPNPR